MKAVAAGGKTRSQQLKDHICYKTGKEAKSHYRGEVKICLERARLITQSYRETEGLPEVLRRAKALEKILANMTIYIGDQELIVGNFASDPFSVPVIPELSEAWLEEAAHANGDFKNMLDETGREEVREILKYWKGKALADRVRPVLPDDLLEFVNQTRKGLIKTLHGPDWGGNYGTPIPNYKKLFEIGLNGIVKQAEARLNGLKAGRGDLKPEEYIEQRYFLEATIIACKAVIGFSHRYAAKAREMAGGESDGKRRRELEKIAEICDWVPANPPRSLHEALQSLYLVHLVVHHIEMAQQGLDVRLDLLAYPYYQRDKAEGRITREEAQELVECLLVKFEELGILRRPAHEELAQGTTLFRGLNIGGLARDGEYVCNEMSFIVLDAAEALRCLEPSLTFRYHPKVPQELLYRVIDTIRYGMGYPAIFNDEVAIPMMMKSGVSLEDARDSTYGCVTWFVPGKNMTILRPISKGLNTLRCFELALFGGKDKRTGFQEGYTTPDPETFTSIQDVMKAYLAQLDYFVGKLADLINFTKPFYGCIALPFTSSLIDGCIERGQDCSTWGVYQQERIVTAGLINIADSLAAMKKLVFEEKSVCMRELIEALRANWQGKEELRQRFLKVPKFGNDDDYVDEIAREVHIRTIQAFESHKDSLGNPLTINGSNASYYFGASRKVGATPDGRRDGEICADGSISPMVGRDKLGPTALLKSTSKVDPMLTHTLLLNQRFMPQFLEGDSKKLFADYLKTWADLGHYHIQFNVVDSATLRDAQKHPEKYPDLLVRVAGYSAYFVDLARDLQESIVQRMEQKLC